MRLIFLMALFTLVSCASSDLREGRNLASVEDLQRIKFGSVETAKSTIKVFPPEFEKGIYRNYFFLELRDQSSDYIDIIKSDLVVLDQDQRPFNFNLNRTMVGRYYLIIESQDKVDSKDVNITIQKKKLLALSKVSLQVPVLENSKITIVNHDRAKHRAVFQLELKDEKSRPLNLVTDPELILDGDGVLTDIHSVRAGVWEFTVDYSEQNHIIYISVRAQGTYFREMFRFHHVEK